ncbi:hypothetical protein [Candidatus Harpocratesius sp.]
MIQKKNKKSHEYSPEEKVLKNFEKELITQKKYLVALELSIKYQEELQNELTQLINSEFKSNSELFHIYFKNHSEPIFAYDIEEIHKKLLCFCAIEVFPSLNYKVYIKVVKNIFRSENKDLVLQAKIRRIFSKIDANIVISHGCNIKERQLALKSKKRLENSELCLQNALKSKNDAYCISGIGLSAFEDYFGYERIACKFFKHKWHWKSFFRAMNWSYRNLLLQSEHHICLDCHKTQNVLLYCLEDAFVSMMIFIWYEKNKEKILG